MKLIQSRTPRRSVLLTQIEQIEQKKLLLPQAQLWPADQYGGCSICKGTGIARAWRSAQSGALCGSRAQVRRAANDLSIFEFEHHFQAKAVVAGGKKYQLVVASYSLGELPNAAEQRRALKALWDATEDILVLIEPGTPSGSAFVRSARSQVSCS